jgi:hypothetical protein
MSVCTSNLCGRIGRRVSRLRRDAGVLVEPVYGSALQLTNSLAGDPEQAADLRSRTRSAVLEAVAQLHYSAVTLLDVA